MGILGFVPPLKMAPSQTTASETDAILRRAAKFAAEWLDSDNDRQQKVVDWCPPEVLRQKLDLELPRSGMSLDNIFSRAQEFMGSCVRTGHPYFFNQLYTGSDPAALLGEWMATLANASMYTYEVAPVFTLMEEELIKRMGALVGWNNCEGVFNPGGSISNLMALLASRNSAFPHAKEYGLRESDRPLVFHSAEAHYSVPRAASVAGMGLCAAREVPVDKYGAMRAGVFKKMVAAAKDDGFNPFMVVATSGTTMPGAFDPIEPLADIASGSGMWLHVDAALGGNALFSLKHRHLLEGIERADSVSWNPHKTMGVPLSCSALLLRERGRLKATNALNADYLFHDTAEASCDRGDMSLQCGRRVDVLKLWLSWLSHGDDGYRLRVEHAFEMVEIAHELVTKREGFELAREPQGCTILFHYLPPSLRGQERNKTWLERMERATITLRERIKHQGRIMFNYASVSGIATLRLVLTHPQLCREDLEFVFEEITAAGSDL